MNIRNIIRNSGALIRIEGGEKKDRLDDEHKAEGSSTSVTEFQDTSNNSEVEEGQGDGPAAHTEERKVIYF